MSDQDNQIKKYLSKLGLSEEEIQVYLSLIKHGESTTLEISRNSGISRTQVYRIIEQMKNKGLVEEIIDKYTTRARAIDISKLEIIVNNQYQKAQELKNQFFDIKTILSGFIGDNQPQTKVLYYRGQSGLQQLAWNALRAKSELVGYSYRSWQEAIGLEFAKKWYREAINRNFSMREIYSDEFKKSIKKEKQFYLMSEYKNFKYQAKYISSKILNINHQVDIYNDVVAFYNWYQGEVFGIEIYNQKISYFQRQIFEVMWQRARKTK